MQPKHQIFTFTDSDEESAIDELVKEYEIEFVDDEIMLALQELYDIEHPEEKDLDEKTEWKQFVESYSPLHSYGHWVYYPWLSRLVHAPPVEDLRSLRTSRNRNLITRAEQKSFYDTTIFIAGLSVGSNIVEALVSQGVGGKFIIADMDEIEPSNLNRIREPYWKVGIKKTEALTMKVAEIDPFLEVVIEEEGVTVDTLNRLKNTYQPDIVIDEIDSLEMKIRLRHVAKELKKPLLSAADNGDSTLLDIERYDHKDTELFNGRIPQSVIDRLLKGGFERKDLGLLIGKYFVGPKNIPLRMYESLDEVGKTLPSWPQLGGAAAISGVSVAYACMKIIRGEAIDGGRFVIGPDRVLGGNLDKESQQKLESYQNRLDSIEFN